MMLPFADAEIAPVPFDPGRRLDTGCQSASQVGPVGLFRAAQAAAPLDSQRDFTRYDGLKLDAGLDREMPDARWVDAASRFLQPLGVTSAELGAIGRFPASIAATVLAAVRAQGENWARPRRKVDYDGPVGREGLAALMPAGLEALPGTGLDAHEWGDLPAFDRTVVGRLAAIGDAAVRAAAALDLLLYHRDNPLSGLKRPLAAWERVDDLVQATELDLRRPGDVALLLLRYLAGEEFGSDGPHARLEVLDRLGAAHGAAGLYALGRDGAIAALVRAAAPASPDPTILGEAATAFRAAARVASYESAKAQALPFVKRFASARAAARARAQQAHRMAMEGRRVARWMVKRGVTGPVGFSYVDRVVSADGRHGRGKQRIYMVAWPATALREEVADGLPLQGADVPGWTERVFFEFDRVEAIGHGACEPWFVEHLRAATLLPVGALDDDLRQARRDALVRLELPNPRYRPRGLAGHADAVERDLMAAALTKDLLVVPVEAFAHGMLLAFALLEVMGKTICRVGEAQQMVYGAAGWEDRLIRGEPWPAFLAIPKDHLDPLPLPLDGEAMRLLRRLKDFVRGRSGSDGPMPVMAPARSLAAKVGDGDFVFSHDGRALENDALNYLLQVLLAGVCPITTHAIRHAAAKAAKDAGLPDLRLARVMNFKGEGLGQVPRYTGDLGEQRAIDAAWFSAEIATADALHRDEWETR